MFVCLELETEDVTVWAEVDKVLANKFGLTSVIWGQSGSTTNHPCQLPSNLYYVQSPIETAYLCDTIKKELDDRSLSFSLVVIQETMASANLRPTIEMKDVEK